MARHYLEPLFAPSSIAVFGASEQPDAVGARVYRNLLDGGFEGPVYAINPKYTNLGDRPCYPSITAIKEKVDLAVIATPAATVPDLIRACGGQGVQAAVVLSAGFSGQDGMGRSLAQGLLDEAGHYGIRLLGPNCLGLMRPSAKFNATFSNNLAQPGSLALISQSGALCTAILDWADAHQVGFSAMVSVGDSADVGFGDLLDYLAMDPETRSILLYVEGVRNARSFMSGLRTAARLKPVIVIKAGRHAEGSRAAMSHTGALVGADDVFEAALQRAGVVRAHSIEQLFAAAQLLVTHHRVRGNRLAIVTNAGGPGVMATDRAVDQGVRLAQLSPATLEKLDRVLPAHWPRDNPVDILGDATPERYGAAVDLCLRDDNVDGALVLLTPQAMTNPTAAAEAVIQAAAPIAKPILTCWLGETQVREGRASFADHQVPSFVNPESALEAFGFLAQYHHNQKMLFQAPDPLGSHRAPDIAGAKLIIEGALTERRSILSAMETRAVLHAFHIPVSPALNARSPNEALAAAEYLGFPVALKILSPDISHKSDVDGVRLNIENAEMVRHAYTDLVNTVHKRRPEAVIEGVTVEKMYRNRNGRELLVGVIDDPIFGPVITFGAGGTAVEVLRDRAVALPPLNELIAESMIDHTRVARLLGPFRNLPPADRAAIVRVLLRLSEMVCELPWIKELDINPLMADDRSVSALDARIVVHQPPPGRRRYGHMAIHPYPRHLVSRVQLSDGTDITIRPIRPEDAEMVQIFVRAMSSETKFFRFLNSFQELSQDMLIRLTQLDYDRELALIATMMKDGVEVELGVARYFTNPDGLTAEFAMAVADEWQGRGIGTRLMSCLIDAAREKGFRSLVGGVLASNVKMLKLIQRLEFARRASREDPGLVVVVKAL